MYPKIGILVFLLFCLAALLYWQPHESSEPVVAEQVVGNDFYLNDFELKSFSDSGDVSHVTRGQSLKRQTDTGAYVLQAPQILLTDNQGRQWQLSAESGDIDESMSHAALTGKVLLVQPGNQQMQMNTPVLRVDTVARRAETDAGVEIIQGQSRLSSQKLLIDLAQGHLELNTNVKGIYVPQ